MPTKNINLTDHFSTFVDRMVASGKYESASEVLRSALRLLEERTAQEDQKLSLLKRLAKKGLTQLDQGEGVALANANELRARIAKLGTQAG